MSNKKIKGIDDISKLLICSWADQTFVQCAGKRPVYKCQTPQSTEPTVELDTAGCLKSYRVKRTKLFWDLNNIRQMVIQWWFIADTMENKNISLKNANDLISALLFNTFTNIY